MTLSPCELATFEESGFLLLGGLISEKELAILRDEVDRLIKGSPTKGGVRNVLQKSPLLAEFASSGPPADLARSVLGDVSRALKLTIFDKILEANWKVPWHQDLTIAVTERRDTPGFGPWTVKDGVVHVQPPISIPEQILAIRLHLDSCDEDNGALRVLPGTHRLGRLADSEIASLRKQIPEQVCPVCEGGAMLMRPLLLHASSACSSPSRRRVLHFEYSAAELGHGLAWPGG